MRGIFEAPAARPSKSHLLERYTQREPEPFVRFDAYPAATSEDVGLSVELDHELCDDVPVRVLVSPGTLPGSAAQALRRIADWIERDRRLLSARHWQGVARRQERSWRAGARGGRGPSGRQRRPGLIRHPRACSGGSPPLGAARRSRQPRAGGLRRGADPDRGARGTRGGRSPRAAAGARSARSCTAIPSAWTRRAAMPG